MSIKVKVGIIPGTIQEVALDDDAKLAAALEVASIDSSGYEIRLNGNVTGRDASLSDGDEVILAKSIKGALDTSEVESMSMADLREIDKAIKERRKFLSDEVTSKREERLENAAELSSSLAEGKVVTFLHKGEELTSKVIRVSKKSFTVEEKSPNGKNIRKDFSFLLSIDEED